MLSASIRGRREKAGRRVATSDGTSDLANVGTPNGRSVSPLTTCHRLEAAFAWEIPRIADKTFTKVSGDMIVQTRVKRAQCSAWRKVAQRRASSSMTRSSETPTERHAQLANKPRNDAHPRRLVRLRRRPSDTLSWRKSAQRRASATIRLSATPTERHAQLAELCASAHP